MLSIPRPSARYCGLLLLPVALVLGCGGGEDIETIVLRCAEASGAQQSENDTLRSMIERVKQERGLPLQLDGATIADKSDAATALASIYTVNTHQRLGDPVAKMLGEALEKGPSQEIDSFLKDQSSLVSRTADAVDMPRCRFSSRHAHGFFGSLGWLDDASLATRLMLLRSLDRSAEGDPAAAAAEADLLRALRVAHSLSKVDRVESRVLAATLRAEALLTAGVLFEGGSLRKPSAETLYGLLREQLADWPHDKRMLVGDRALVIHSYEALREGLIDRLLTAREITDLRERGVYEMMEKAIPQQIDSDQVLYLRRMELLMLAAEQPFFDRLAAFEQALDRSRMPMFAERVFLVDQFDAQRAVARDRARCEAWALALAAAAGLPAPNHTVCPTNGEEYQLIREEGQVVVVVGDPGVYDPVCPQW